MLTGEEKRGRRETVTWEQIEAYLAQLGEKGCSAQTLSSYRWDLRSFWESLPQGELDRFTVLRWQEQMREKGLQFLDNFTTMELASKRPAGVLAMRKERETEIASEEEIPGLLRQILEAGGKLYAAQTKYPTLEDIYFSLTSKKEEKP